MAALGVKNGFTVWRPAWLPDGFEVDAVKQSDADVLLVVEYAAGDKRVVVAQLIGDLGEDKPKSAVAWGAGGEIAKLYADYPYWSLEGADSGNGIMVHYSATSPNVMLSTKGLSETDVLRIVTQMEKVSP